MAPSSFNLISLIAYFMRRRLNSSGLTQKCISIDDETKFQIWVPKSHDQSKRSFLIIHGFGPLSKWQWRHQVEFFSSHFNLYVPELLFFGESTTKSKERTEVFQAECVAKLMEKLDVERYNVMGTSYGGFVSYHIARMWPERIEKIVIASSGVNMKESDVEIVLKAAKVDNIEDLLIPKTASQFKTLMSMVMFKKADIPKFLISQMIKQLYGDSKKEKAELLHNITLGKNDVVNLSKLPQEVLLVWGQQDKIFPIEMAYELRTLIGENVKLETIVQASHIPQNEHPSKFNNIVKTFLGVGSA